MAPTPTGSSALRTDRYELTMLAASLKDGTAHRRCVFELFARRLSGGRRFGVVAGTGRVLEQLRASGFTEFAFVNAGTSAETLEFRQLT